MKNLQNMKELIMRTAFTIFGSNGFGNTTIKEIATAAGIAPGSIYNYFSDKEDLFRSTVREGWKRFLEKLQVTVSSSMPVKEKYKSFIDFAMESLKTAQPLLKGMLFDANEREMVQDNIEKIINYLLGFFKQENKGVLIKTYIDEKQRRFFLEVTIMGILLKVALCSPQTVDEEISGIKGEIYRLIEN